DSTTALSRTSISPEFELVNLEHVGHHMLVANELQTEQEQRITPAQVLPRLRLRHNVVNARGNADRAGRPMLACGIGVADLAAQVIEHFGECDVHRGNGPRPHCVAAPTAGASARLRSVPTINGRWPGTSTSRHLVTSPSGRRPQREPSVIVC